MTLIDSRPGIGALLQRINDELGLRIDAEAAADRLGPPLDQLIAPWVGEADRPAVVERYRELYPSAAVAATQLLPGAREALAAVRRHQGQILIVTGKFASNAILHAEHLDLDHDVLVGDLWAEGKATVLREHGAGIYVGDHTGDVRAAQAAGAVAVAVATGGIAAGELRSAGADVVLASLAEFPRWLATQLTSEAP